MKTGDVEILNNIISNNEYGVFFRIETASVNDNILSNNIISNNDKNGVILIGIDNVLIQNNLIKNNKESQIYVTNSNAPPQTSKENDISGNKIRHDNDEPNYGIEIDSGIGILINNNDLYNSGDIAAILDNGSDTNFGAGNRLNDGTWNTGADA